MIFAAIGDIDGHDTALNGTLKTLEEQGILTILHTGNAVVGARGGNEIMRQLESHSVTCVQGELDRLAIRYSRKQQSLEKKLDDDLIELLRWTHENLSSQNLEVLRDWRKSLTMDLEGLTVFLCHGSPGNRREIITPDTPLVKLQRQRENAQADIVVCGGADRAFDMDVEGTFFVCPGPLVTQDGTVQYVLINTEEDPWTATVETVEQG
jgi:predicted phosphodiesterase